MKKNIVGLFVINLLLIVSFLFVFSKVYQYEFYYFVGNENISVEDIQEYIQSEDIEKYIKEGKDKIKESGYSNSIDKYIKQKTWKVMLPCSLIVIMIDGIICFWLFRKSEQYAMEEEKYKKENHIIKQENENLKKHLITDKEEMMKYEENLYHQLKTPLTGLKLSLETIDSDHNKETLDIAEKEVEKMSKLITLFLKDRKMSANQIRFYFEEQDCISLLNEAIGTVRPITLKCHKEVRIESDFDSFFISCDEVWLRECFTTLLENSIEHGKEDTLITVRKQNTNLLIQIISLGTLLDEKEINQFFERFYTDNEQHFGIGLHMSKMIIENHHGTLRAYNVVSENQAVFEIKLPILSGSKTYDVSDM